MTKDEVIARIAEIRLKADEGDDEVAHSREDALHQAVLRAIAQGAPNAAELATEALKTVELDFARWCA